MTRKDSTLKGTFHLFLCPPYLLASSKWVRVIFELKINPLTQIIEIITT
jgi:hypothetical protein